MCEYCWQSVCPSGCPNAPEPPAVETCIGCNDSIVVGDDYIDYQGECICKRCCSDMSIKDLMDIVDMTVSEILCELGGVEKVAEYD